jgi:SAM-dependent methyltransferase
MARLKESIENGTPAGLEVFGKWPTIYPALSSLPEPAKTSWFSFDHFYSDNAFPHALTHVFQYKPKLIYDVGGNTGRWALRCVEHNPDVRVTVLDLPEQVTLLKKEIKEKPNGDRIDGIGLNILGEGELPGEADLWWMSQFLDCFSEEQCEGILRRIRRAVKPGAKVCILEPFCDRQAFETGAAVLNAFSLYFTCIANGNSRFFRAEALLGCLKRTGFSIEKEIDNVGFGGHSLLVCTADESK